MRGIVRTKSQFAPGDVVKANKECLHRWEDCMTRQEQEARGVFRVVAVQNRQLTLETLEGYRSGGTWPEDYFRRMG